MDELCWVWNIEQNCPAISRCLSWGYRSLYRAPSHWVLGRNSSLSLRRGILPKEKGVLHLNRAIDPNYPNHLPTLSDLREKPIREAQVL